MYFFLQVSPTHLIFSRLIHVFTQAFTPGAGAAPEYEEDEEEECSASDTETIQTLGELSAVELPDMVPSSVVPLCESKTDQKLYQLAMQFKDAMKLQEGQKKDVDQSVVVSEVGSSKNASVDVKKCDMNKSKPNPHVLPSFVS